MNDVRNFDTLKNKYNVLKEVIAYSAKATSLEDFCNYVCNSIIHLGLNNCIIISKLNSIIYSTKNSNSENILKKINEQILVAVHDQYKIVNLGYNHSRINSGFLYINCIYRNEKIYGYFILHSSDNVFTSELLNLIDTLLIQVGVYFENSNIKSKEIEAFKDCLTGVYNRSFLKIYEQNLIYQNYDKLSFVMLDIDNFKNINDTYGHQFGDLVLRKLSNLLQDILLNITDCIIRYGGEEFLILFPNLDLEKTVDYAEIIRVRFNEETFDTIYGQQCFTISLGVCTANYSKKISDMEQYITLADKGLYLAKNKGRNCVVKCTKEMSLKLDAFDTVRKIIWGNKEVEYHCYKIEFIANSSFQHLYRNTFNYDLLQVVRNCFREEDIIKKINKEKILVITKRILDIKDIKERIKFNLSENYYKTNISFLGLSFNIDELQQFIELG